MILYHLDSRYLGRNPVLKPRVPRTAATFENITIKRISVGEDIKDCLLGITEDQIRTFSMFKDFIPEYWVYETKKRIRDIDFDGPRRWVQDWDITGEMWLRHPTRFRLVGKICIDMENFPDYRFIHSGLLKREKRRPEGAGFKPGPSKI